MDTDRRNSIIKDIMERQNIIERYSKYGQLDREDAIKKIQSLRMIDAKVAEATAVGLAIDSIPFVNAPDNMIIAELRFQIGVLSSELASMEDK